MPPDNQVQQVSSASDAATASVNILGVRINRVSYAHMLQTIDQWVACARSAQSSADDTAYCRQICTVNPEFVVDAYRDLSFAKALNRAELRVADGVGIVWAARLQGVTLPERITGSDGIFRICEYAAEKGWRVFFLGAAPGVAQRTAGVLRKRYPGLTVAGAYAGSPEERDWPLIQRQLDAAKPDVLLVAYGHPRQDLWIDRHRRELPASVAIGVGGAFDFVAGVTVRAPAWMRRRGLEWLHRLIRQPWRWRRMAKLPEFAVLAIRQALTGQRD